MKYIDADKLKAEIERRIAQWQPYTFACASQIASEAFDRIDELKGLLIYITSLQQEQLVNKDLGTLITCDIIEMTVKRAIDKPQDKEKEEELMTRKINYLRSLEENYVQQEQPDFDDVDPKHLVHSHYTKVREIKTGKEFWAEYSIESAEWYEAGTGNAYSISDVEIVKVQPEVDWEKEWKSYMESRKDDLSGNAVTVNMKDLARYFYELGLNARKEE